jgi:beta-galactosidase
VNARDGRPEIRSGGEGAQGFGRREALKGLAALAAVPFMPEAGRGGRRGPAASGRAKGVTPSGRDRRFDDGWRFHLGDAPGAERPDFDDSTWRALDIPHDWSIEDLPPRTETTGEAALWAPGNVPRRVGPFDADASPGKTATGFVLGGTGWYRKRFPASAVPTGMRAKVLFEGVYMDADVWLNGRHLGSHPYGYTSFAFDLTAHLRRDGGNVLAVRVRNEGKNSRWYSGSGIYRHVWLTVTGDVRVPLWGVHVSTPEVKTSAATVRVATRVENRGGTPRDVTVRVRLLGPGGVQAAAGEAVQPVPAGGDAENVQTFSLRSPSLWSTESPELYRAEVELLAGRAKADAVSVAFGVRRIEVDAGRGLRVNGRPVKLKGACLHHDNGVLGAAAIDRAEERRVGVMKANGFNAIRCSHNPPSPAFLDACDRLGVLVIDEAFDMWHAPKNPEDYHLFFDDWWRRDVEGMVLRDRNHPSIIMWSIGNEIHERAEPEGVEIAAWLVDAIKRLDASRPVTAAICSFSDYPGKNRSWAETDPAFTHLDVGGYNYAWQEYEKDHARHPSRVMLGTESFPGEAFENWRQVEAHLYVIGDFVWAGMDYLGETGIGHTGLEKFDYANVLRPFSWFNAFCGDIDLVGGKKPQSYFRDVVWGRSRLEMAVQRPVPEGRTENVSPWGWSDELRSWAWPGSEGRPLKVRVYAPSGEVRLLLNGKEVGTKAASAGTKLRAEFEVPYAPGELRAVALEGGHEVASLAFKTSGPPASLRLRPDRAAIRADRNDLCYVTVEVLDAAGSLVPDAVVPVSFALSGAGELAAVGSANPKDAASFRRPLRKTFHGRCLAVLRPTGGRGTIMLRAASDGLTPAALTVRVG